MAASVGLGVGTLPLLPAALWPPAWFRAAGIDLGHENYAVPMAEQVVAMTDAILARQRYGSLSLPGASEYAEDLLRKLTCARS